MRGLLAAAACAWLLCASDVDAQLAASYITEVVTIPSGGLKLPGVLGRPEGPGPFPAYISNHGSMTIQEASRKPWTAISRGSLPDTLARSGYVVVVLARRGYKGSEGAALTYSQSQGDRTVADVMRGAEEEAGDVVATLEYLIALPYVDKNLVAVGGVSLGGLLSVMAAAREPRVKALISMAGGYRQTSRAGLRGGDEAWGPLQEIWKDGARRIRAPMLILWSKNDMLLEVDVGRELEKELRRAGKSVEMTVYPAFQENGHRLFTRTEGYPIFVPDAVRFLDAHLKR
jgi:dienelactone hydrolase